MNTEKVTETIEKKFLEIADKPVREMTEAEELAIAPKPTLAIVKEENDADPAPKKGKRTRAPKPRTLEELASVPLKNMTEKEKDLVIESQKEQLILANNKIGELKQNCDAAFKRARAVEDDFNAMENYYKERLAYITNNTRMFYQSICLATKGDVK